MPRPRRIQFSGACYHVSHGLATGEQQPPSGEASLFASPEDTECFLHLLADIVQRYGVIIHAYCLLPTGYHLLVQTPRPNLHEVMRYMNQLYAQQLRRRRDGTVAMFGGRYSAWLVEADRYLSVVAKVIHRMPVGLAGEDMLTQYRWSSARTYAGKQAAPVWLTTERVQQQMLQQTGGLTYEAYLATPLPKVIAHYYALKRKPPVLGSEAYCEAIQRQYLEGDAGAVQPWRTTPVQAVDMDHLLRVVADGCGVAPEAMLQPHRGRRNRARHMAIYLARSVARVGASDVARYFGLASHSAVCNVMASMTRALEQDPALQAQMRHLGAQLHTRPTRTGFLRRSQKVPSEASG